MTGGTGIDSSDTVRTPESRLKQTVLSLAIGALGVVYGDIGTSPLYAFRECFNPAHGLSITPDNILGILSLIFWSLMLVVTVKYVFVVLRADNEGEGGIFALMARIVSRETVKDGRTLRRTILIMLGLCGSALLVADGMITPAITVLSAMEGLEVATTTFKPYVVPSTMIILACLFLVQKKGTAIIGSWFGPMMLIWFISIAALGARWIAREPEVFLALNPIYAFNFFKIHHLHGLVVLGAVVLCVTGCEALYADLGHFGRRPIAFAWYVLVLPCSLLNYLGQGAFLLATKPSSVGNTFFSLAPDWLLYPLVALAAVASVIASQALISGMFSLGRQAVQLNYLPRLHIVHTSRTVHGQIFMPGINAILGIACIALVLGFRNSSDMAAAYGIAVIGTMATTSMLMFSVEYRQWKWRLWQAVVVTGIFLALDGLFLVGNIQKVFHGGWFPIAAGFGVLAVMTTWKKGYDAIARFMTDNAIPVDEFVRSLASEDIHRVKGTALFIMSQPDVTPRVLLHHLKHIKVLHEQVLLMSVVTENTPVVPDKDQVRFQDLGNGFTKVMVSCGFMQSIDMREIIRHCTDAGLKLNGEVSYFIGHMTLKASGRVKMPLWRKLLFAFLFHNERSSTEFLGIPPNRVVEMGEQAEL